MLYFSLKEIPNIILFIYDYIIALSITKLCTICQCLCVQDEVLYVLNVTFSKSEYYKPLGPPKQRRDTVS